MTKNKSIKQRLVSALLALVLMITSLLGTTFAWFTDVVSSNSNVIESGKLDAEMYWSEDYLLPSSQDWKNADGVSIFNHDNWEPGYTEVRYVKIKNAGTLSFKWRLTIEAQGSVTELADVIDVYYVNPCNNQIASLQGLSTSGVLSSVIDEKTAMSGALLPNGTTEEGYVTGEIVLAIAMHMQEDAGNTYQEMSIGDGFTLNLIATQFDYEEDSLGKGYDTESQWPNTIIVGGNSASVNVTTDSENKLTEDKELKSDNGAIAADLPEGTLLLPGTDKVVLNVSDVEDAKANVTCNATEATASIDVHIAGIDPNNDKVIIVYLAELLPTGLNMGNFRLYHVEDGQTVPMTLVSSTAEIDVHNEFVYDPVTGDVTMGLCSFSEIALVNDTENAWKGTPAEDFAGGTGLKNDPYLIANADQFVYFGDLISNDNENYGNKYYKLVADINFGGEENANNGILFYPIGYHKEGGSVAALDNDDAPEFLYFNDNYDDSEYSANRSSASVIAEDGAATWYTYGGSFKGTFDGDGHKIANIYQNTWQLKGNYEGNYWNAAMGIFGYVNGGTVKNLTVNNFSSDGEFTPTGVIAAYAADSTFENIAITNCNPRVYNTGNGGIVGIGGNSSDPHAYKLTFTNITIDNSNKISALWGSWDVACGGLVGMFRGAGHVYMTNCHVAAQIDVYNDVCGNYQYYWYRYSGMMIGTNKNMTTDANGYTVPETDKFHATDCTVHFGNWNNYYYCELVANSVASYTHDHQFSRLTEVDSIDVENMTVTVNGVTTAIPTSGKVNYVVVNGEASTENATCYHFVNGEVWEHEDAGYHNGENGEKFIDENKDSIGDLKEDKQHVYLPFNQLFTGYGWGVKHIPVYNGENYAFDGITILDREVADSVVKFESKFNGDFLYRVGNMNTVSLGSLFAEIDDVKPPVMDSGVWVTIRKIDENSNVSGTFIANTTDWTKGTIQFNGTGVVEITIQDYNFCKPTTLRVEVVDAVNATTATSAKKNNVVLLQDCGFSSLEVFDGYTLYGNGFTMTCGSDSAALDMGYAFVTLNNGTLDNVQIVCPNFDYAVLYKSNMTESGNRSETTDKTRYFNVKSGVMVSGNSQILNSRISGARAAVNVSGGNCVIDNSRIELGAVASLLIGAANSVTLRDVTLVQKPTASTYDSSKILMGFSALFICDANGDAAPVTLEGTLVQNAWVNESDKQFVPSAGQSIISTVLAKTEYLHDIDGDGKNESLNLGFAYMPESLTSKVNTTTITDNRIDKDVVSYDYAEVSILNGKTYVYSYKNTNGTADSFKTESDYVPDTQSDIITVNYSDTSDGLTSGKSFGTDGWFYELNVDLDKLSGYSLDFSKLSMSVNGSVVTDFKVDGSTKPTSPVEVTAGGTKYTLTATANGKEYIAIYKVTGTETSKESPSLVASNYEAGLCVASSYGGTWSGAAPALEGIQIKYWSVAEKQYKTINLSDYTPTTKGKQNGTNTTWTYSPDNGDFTLTLTGGQVHSGNSVNAMPVVCDGKLYFVAASSNGLVNTGNSARAVPVSYSFKDNNNGDVLTFSHTWSVAENKDAQYKYSDFCNGTLTKLENCITPDTLITLADGTQVRVDSLTGNEELLVWNMETGKLDKAPIMFVDSEAEAAYEVIKLYFSDGTEVKVIYEHGFWDYDLNKYVYLDGNAADYIGHTFAKQNGDTLEKVLLVDVVIETVVTTAWSPVTVGHLCYFVNGMLSMPGGVGGLFNIFKVDPETMAYDIESMQKDIETFGLYTYEELNAISPLSEDMFNAAGGAYLKISIGKGNLTENELISMVNRYSKFFETVD